MAAGGVWPSFEYGRTVPQVAFHLYRLGGWQLHRCIGRYHYTAYLVSQYMSTTSGIVAACAKSVGASHNCWNGRSQASDYVNSGGSKGQSGDRMELKRDDWVKTESGEVGKVVHISRLTVFVVHIVPCKEDRIEAYLESQLTKVDRPVRQ
jgi:hypothetical protein